MLGIISEYGGVWYGKKIINLYDMGYGNSGDDYPPLCWVLNEALKNLCALPIPGLNFPDEKILPLKWSGVRNLGSAVMGADFDLMNVFGIFKPFYHRLIY